MTENDGLKNWLNTEKEKIEREWEQKKKEKGYNDWFKWEDGVLHKFTVLTNETNPPREHTGEYGMRKVFIVKTEDGKLYDLEVNPTTKWYRTLISLISEGKINIAVIRTGMGKNTKYRIKDANKPDVIIGI